MSFKLRNYQEDAVKVGMEILNSKKKRFATIVAPTGCHTEGYEIRMYDGTLKKVEDIKEGEFLMGDDSTKRKVLRKIEGFGKIYKITPVSRAEPFYVNEDHILYLEATTIKESEKNTYPKNVEVSVKEYLTWAKSRKSLYKLKKKDISYSKFHYKKLPVDPYFLGLWLGDGNSNSSTITTMDSEIRDYLKNFSNTINLDYKEHPGKNTKAFRCVLKKTHGLLNPLKEELNNIGVLNNKHIPFIYKTSSKKDRIELIKGLMDSDGYVGILNKAELSFSNQRLSRDVSEVLNSLGYSNKLRKRYSTCTNCKDKSNTRIRYRICFIIDENIKTFLPRRSYKKAEVKNLTDKSRIGFRIEYDREDNFYGFTLDKNQLYLDYQSIVHHNSGKSLIIAELANRFNKPLICLQPSKELLMQNSSKLASLGGEFSIYSASLNEKSLSKLTFATIGSLMAVKHLIKQMGVKHLIVDESHLKSKNSSQLKELVKYLGVTNIVAFTATPVFLEGGMQGAEVKMMSKTKSSFIKEIAHVTQIQELISNNFWSKIVYKKVHQDDSALQINSAGSDFTQESMEQFYLVNDLEQQIINEVKELKKEGRRSILVFVPTIEEAENVSAKIRGSRAVHSKLNASDRDEIVNGFKNGDIRVVINCSVLSTGFDMPELDSIILARSTMSIALYYQILGRIVRIHPDKKDAKIVDLSNSTERFGRIEDLNYEFIEGFGWGLFSKDILLTNFPLQAKTRPTKASIKKKIEWENRPVTAEDNLKFYFGKYNGKSVKEVMVENKSYLTWLLDNKEFQWYGDKGKALKKCIENHLGVSTEVKKESVFDHATKIEDLKNVF